MNDKALLQKQYKLVKDSRNTLFNFCDTISEIDFVRNEHPFGTKSISYLVSHIANCYLFWMGSQVLKMEILFIDYEASLPMKTLRKHFTQIDVFMDSFFESNISPTDTVSYTTETKQDTATVLALFTHVITHEFHHKGQILTLSRQLGYIPLDTDVMR